MKMLRKTMVQLADGRWFCPQHEVAFDTKEQAEAFVKMAYTPLMHDYLNLLRKTFE